MTGQFAYPPDREEASAKKAAALESLLIEKGVITPQTVDKVLAYFETEMTPLNGKKIVVKAWTDPEFAEKIVVDTPAAIAELDFPTAWQVPKVSTCRRWPTPLACTTW